MIESIEPRRIVAAVVLAAGLSSRMGRPKLVLPWRDTTVIGQVVKTLNRAGVEDVVVVTGGAMERMEPVLEGLPARVVFNPHFVEDQMALSLQVGLSELAEDVDAALVVLGDQPQMQVLVVQAVINAYHDSQATLVVPSYANRRGHPWLVDRSLWGQLKSLSSPSTLRDFLTINEQSIYYLTVDNDSILRDLDTPSDYARERQRVGKSS